MSKKHTETVQKQFAKTVEAFSKTATRDTPEILAEKVAFAKPESADLSLDVACGPGELVLGLAPRVSFARGVDLTLEMLRQAREFQLERKIANASFDCGEAEHLPYPAHSFDLITCQCSFHHMPKPELALAEMVRALKPAGRLMIIDTLAPESDHKFEVHNKIEAVRDPSHTQSLRLTSFTRRKVRFTVHAVASHFPPCWLRSYRPFQRTHPRRPQPHRPGPIAPSPYRSWAS